MQGETDPRYVISVAARLVGVHPQTLRTYEREGLVVPQRSEGGQRLYSDADVARLRRIRHLIDDLGVNLAGCDVILRLQDREAELVEQRAALRGAVRGLRPRRLPPPRGSWLRQEGPRRGPIGARERSPAVTEA